MGTLGLNVVLDVYKKGLPNDSPSPMIEVTKYSLARKLSTGHNRSRVLLCWNVPIMH
jgi:hypothetical protein